MTKTKAELKREMKAVVEAIRRHQSFIICSHINPEGDALGSALALASLLKRLGKKAVLANDGGIPDAFTFFPLLAQVYGQPNGKLKPDVAVTVDVPVLKRTGSIKKLIQKVPVSINIDHHVSNHNFADINWVDPKAAAVGEMVYKLFKAFRLKPTRDEAICLYVSIVTDTGSFRYMSTTPEVHRIAADLIATGISPLKVAQDLYECHTANDMKFLGKVLQSIRQDRKRLVTWVEIPNRLLKRAKPGPEIVDELVNFPRAVQTAEVAFTLREEIPGKEIRVSFRSKGRIDVDRIARHFGGGGHMAASGCTIEKTLPEARRQILRVVRKALKAKGFV